MRITHPSPSRKLIAAAFALALSLSACGDDNTGPAGPGGPGTGGDQGPDTPGAGVDGGLSAAQVQAFGTTAWEELDESFAAIVAVSPANPFESVAGFTFAGRIPACATATPETADDPDGDEIPTSLTLTFEECGRTGPNGASLELFGSLTITDPSPAAAGIDVAAEAAELGYEHVRPDGATIRVTRDGSRSLTGGESGVSATEDLVTVREVSGSETITVTKEGTRTFTPDQGETIVPGEERPSGTITVDGSFSWQQGDDTFNFTAETVTPLHYNAACADQPRGRRIDAGAIRYTRTFEGRTETVTLTFTACGEAPTVEHEQAS